MYNLILDFIGAPSGTNVSSSNIYNIAGAVLLLVVIWFLDSLRKILWR